MAEVRFPPDLGSVLLDTAEAAGLPAHGRKEAAVLVAVSDWPRAPSIAFTERRSDLRRHAGEISFPGGRRDPGDPDLVSTAIRESFEEIALDPAIVEIAGALPPVGTFVTSYRVHPFVGLIGADADLVPNPDEVAAVMRFGVEELASAYAMRRIVRGGLPIRTPTFEVERHMIWGATARILAELLRRLAILPDRSR